MNCEKHGAMPGSYCVLCAGREEAERDKVGRERFVMHRKDGAICFGSNGWRTTAVTMAPPGALSGRSLEEPLDPDSIDWSYLS